jgi:hypothetical protein
VMDVVRVGEFASYVKQSRLIASVAHGAHATPRAAPHAIVVSATAAIKHPLGAISINGVAPSHLMGCTWCEVHAS